MPDDPDKENDELLRITKYNENTGIPTGLVEDSKDIGKPRMMAEVIRSWEAFYTLVRENQGTPNFTTEGTAEQREFDELAAEFKRKYGEDEAAVLSGLLMDMVVNANVPPFSEK